MDNVSAVVTTHTLIRAEFIPRKNWMNVISFPINALPCRKALKCATLAMNGCFIGVTDNFKVFHNVFFSFLFFPILKNVQFFLLVQGLIGFDIPKSPVVGHSAKYFLSLFDECLVAKGSP
jgi:hypothetical protein